MSSIVVIQQTDAVHFITDGASYDHNGVVVRIGSKVEELPRSNCIVALRGGGWAASALHFALHLLDSFDAIIDALPNLMPFMLAKFDGLRAASVHPLERHFEVTVAGWSERMDRFAAGVVLTFEPFDCADETGISHMAGYQQFMPFLPGQCYTAPPADVQAAIGRELMTQEDVDAIDPLLDGFHIHEWQRIQGGLYAGQVAYIIGGFAELTTVRKDGIERRIIHEWPDVIGRKITPAGAPSLEALETARAAEKAYHAAMQDLA